MVPLGPALGEQRDVGADHRVDLVLDDPQLALAGRRPRPRDAAPSTSLGAGQPQRRVRGRQPLEQLHQPQQLGGRSGARGRACSCTSASGRAGTARPSRGAGRPRSPAARAVDAGSMSRPSSVGRSARRGCRRRTPACRCWTGARRRRTGAKSLFSAASAGRLPVAFSTTSGASMATRQSPSTYGASAATICRRRSAADTCSSRPSSSSTATPVGLRLAPREVDADEVHGHTLPCPRPRCTSRHGLGVRAGAAGHGGGLASAV